MKYILKIELLSATNPGSGEGWAGMIDSDVVFDEYGIPFIPAKRVKGILRENALDIVTAFNLSESDIFSDLNEKLIIDLFGDRGQDTSAPLAIGNAYLKEYEKIREWLYWAKDRLPHWASPERVITSFTHLRKQTAINAEGVQEPHSLRVTRVLNSGYKINKEYRPYQYFSNMEISTNNKTSKQSFERLLALAINVTSQLGGKRNRGLGKVKCFLLDSKDHTNITKQYLKEYLKPELMEEVNDGR